MLRPISVPVSVARVAVTLWFGTMLVLGAGLLAKHVVALPAPANREGLSKSLSVLRVARARAPWLAVHVLYAECRCSQRIVAHLISTKRPAGWEEVVLWVGNGDPDPALERAYRVKRLTSAELAQLGVDAAPLLVILGPRNQTLYAGGYTDRKQGPVIEDLRILADAQRASAPAALPVFGCAVTDRLKRALSILPAP